MTLGGRIPAAAGGAAAGGLPMQLLVRPPARPEGTHTKIVFEVSTIITRAGFGLTFSIAKPVHGQVFAMYGK